MNQDTGASRKMLSNESGRFLFPALSPGTYRLFASRPGFKSVAIHNLGLQIDQARELEVELETGGITETVTVAAPLNPLQTETAGVGQVIEG